MTSSRWYDQLALVVELACVTEDRTNDEQRALLRVAAKVDAERRKETVTNPPEWRVQPYLEQLADTTRMLDEGQRRIKPPSEVKAARRRSPTPER